VRIRNEFLYGDSGDVRGSNDRWSASSSIVLEIKTCNRLPTSRQLSARIEKQWTYATINTRTRVL
jgi:hypothetical protein